jgi:ABC-2 type transport system permease protein
MRVRRIRTAIGTGVRSYLRTPVLLALIVIAPAYLIGLFGVLAPDTPVPLEVPGAGATTVPLSNALTVLGVVLSSALVGGFVGLFVIQSASDADGRLVIAGFEPSSLLLARAALVAFAAAVTVGVSMGVVSLIFEPASPVVLAVAGMLMGLTYGAVGVVIGSQVDLLPGVWILLFAPLLDVVLFQNPLASETDPLAPFLPGHWAMALATDAGFVSGTQSGTLFGGVAYLGVMTVVAMGVYYWSMR